MCLVKFFKWNYEKEGMHILHFSMHLYRGSYTTVVYNPIKRGACFLSCSCQYWASLVFQLLPKLQSDNYLTLFISQITCDNNFFAYLICPIYIYLKSFFSHCCIEIFVFFKLICKYYLYIKDINSSLSFMVKILLCAIHL